MTETSFSIIKKDPTPFINKFKEADQSMGVDALINEIASLVGKDVEARKEVGLQITQQLERLVVAQLVTSFGLMVKEDGLPELFDKLKVQESGEAQIKLIETYLLEEMKKTFWKTIASDLVDTLLNPLIEKLRGAEE